MGCDLHLRLLLLLVAVTRPLHGARGVHRRDRLVTGWVHPPPQFVVPCTLQERGLSDYQHSAIVRAHNDYRSLVAKGGLPGFQPAADMSEVIWDEDLAFVAQSYVEQCVPQTSAVATSRDFIEEGQNLCIQPLPAASDNETGVMACINAWFDEHAVTPPAVIKSFQNASGPTKGTYENFTQLVWSLSQYVGCGFALVASQDGVTRNLYACNYDAPGNHPGTPVYLAGPACSACPPQTTCIQESGLCRSDAEATDKSIITIRTTREQPRTPTSGVGTACSRRTLLFTSYSTIVGMAALVAVVLPK